MRETESSLQQFGAFFLKRQLVRQTTACTSCAGYGSSSRAKHRTKP